VLALAAERGLPLTFRGAGCSYGDAAFHPEGLILDLQRLRRILAWDPQTGVIDVEPGVTVRDLWRFALGDGWWPPVVSGTMEPTLGGCLAMNIHGKNNWQRGTLGEHCLELDLLLPSGELRTVSPSVPGDPDGDLFHAVIGSFGQLGVITRARLQLKKVASGLVAVRAEPVANLGAMLAAMDEAKDEYEYLVGWIDAFPGGIFSGRAVGRGQIHYARHLEADEDPQSHRTLALEAQDLPETFFGVLPKSILWRLMKPFTHRPGMRLINAAKFRAAATVQRGKLYHQSLAGYSFLLDYVPGWKRAYLPGGLIQHQSFVPREAAEGVFRQQLALCRKRGLPPFLAVLKRHRPDPFLLSHGVDGFSLALDFPVTGRNRTRLWALVRDLSVLVVEAGGRFYPAKDAAIPGELYQATLPEGALARFRELKETLDPDGVLTSALARRWLGAPDP
jgi:decaprenylphospho-beta-D-ribofuranose 2-oxidase